MHLIQLKEGCVIHWKEERTEGMSKKKTIMPLIVEEQVLMRAEEEEEVPLV